MVLKFSFSVHYLYVVFYIYYQFGRLPIRQISGHACDEFSGLSYDERKWSWYLNMEGSLSLWSWLRRIISVKMSIILNTTYQFNGTPIKIPIPLFTEIGKSILKFIGKHRKLWNVKAMLRQKKKPVLEEPPYHISVILQSLCKGSRIVPAQTNTQIKAAV